MALFLAVTEQLRGRPVGDHVKRIFGNFRKKPEQRSTITTRVLFGYQEVFYGAERIRRAAELEYSEIVSYPGCSAVFETPFDQPGPGADGICVTGDFKWAAAWVAQKGVASI